MNDKSKKIGLFSLIMMIFSSIFGFTNMPVAFLQMGYASIIWYIFAAIFFFLPVSMMLAEYGSTFKDEHGGIYAWLSNTIGEKLAFIGTFIWLSSWIVWLINISSKVFIPFSALLFGKDMTQTWAFGPFSATQVVGILAILWIIFVTFFASRGADVISKVSSIGGAFVTGMIFVFLMTIWRKSPYFSEGMDSLSLGLVESYFLYALYFGSLIYLSTTSLLMLPREPR